MHSLVTYPRPDFSDAGFALREGEGVLFASQICEAPEAAKGVQGATRFIMVGKFHWQVNIVLYS